MKKYISIVFIAVFALIGTAAQAQSDAIEKYFEKYMDDESFTMVYVSPRMFRMFAEIDPEDMEEELKEVISDIKGLRILTTENNTMALYKEAQKTIRTSEYEVLMTVRDEGSNVNFLIKEEGDLIKELLLLVGGEDEFVMISFVGNIDLDKISKLSKSMDIDGLEHLENLDDKN